MPGAKWFEGARLNLAEQVFRHHEHEPERPAILSRSELRGLQTLTWGELRQRIAALAHSLRELGVGPGDRVVAYLPNLPETMVAFFAVSSLGRSGPAVRRTWAPAACSTVSARSTPR